MSDFKIWLFLAIFTGVLAFAFARQGDLTLAIIFGLSWAYATASAIVTLRDHST